LNQIAREKNRGHESMPAQNRESPAVVAKAAVVKRNHNFTTQRELQQIKTTLLI
jgi:hypothetical protein